MISFDKVSVRYGTALALAEVTEKVPAGQWLGHHRPQRNGEIDTAPRGRETRGA